MAEKGSKFANMFTLEPEAAVPVVLHHSMEIAAHSERMNDLRTRKSERTPGKRSRTDYKQFSVLLKKQTHKQAVRALDDLENGQDFSDLMEHLLEQWLLKQTK